MATPSSSAVDFSMPRHELIRRNSGYELATALARGTIRAEDMLADYLELIDARESTLRAFVHLDRTQFLSPTDVTGPLGGLPVGIKDIVDVAGMPTRCGSPIYQDQVASGDAPIVSMIRHAGGRIAGKTVTTEFATRKPGPTTNPRNTRHTPGGSSSGSAAAVAAGMLPFAIGTQTGGSVIRPGSYCGIAALKPTGGFFPYAGIKATAWHLDTIGVYGRKVRDVAFFAEAITGQALTIDDESGWTPRIGVMPMQAWEECSADMMKAVASASRAAEKRRAAVARLIPDAIFETAYAAHFIIQDVEIARSLAYEFDVHEHLLSPMLNETIRTGQAISAVRYAQALEDQRAARRASPSLFDDVDVLLAPSAPSAAPFGLESTGSPNLNRLWTLLGMPCVNVPGLLDSAGLPLGVQIIGPIGADRLALRAAAWLEDSLIG
jgi:Asp-tRNA(Asn)/Glu-tRNA(Gln) amidotransferase A subunit family amidase